MSKMTISEYRTAYERLANLTVMTKDVRRAVDAISLALELTKVDREPRNIVVTGVPGVGKSVVAKLVRKAFPAEVELVETPDDPSVKSLRATILEEHGDAFSMRGTSHQLKLRVRRLFESEGKLALLLDEFQHMFEGKPANSFRQSTQMLKNLVNTQRILLVLFGTPPIAGFVRSNDELRSRISRVLRIRSLSLANPDVAEDLQKMLSAYSDAMPVPSEIALTQDEMKQRLYVATGNVMRPTANLIKEACNVAFQENAPRVTLAHYSEGFRAAHEDWLEHIQKGAQGKQLRLPSALQDPFQAKLSTVQNQAAQLVELEVGAARRAVERSGAQPSWVAES